MVWLSLAFWDAGSDPLRARERRDGGRRWRTEAADEEEEEEEEEAEAETHSASQRDDGRTGKKVE
ncbi:hypothetical protein K0M31_000589 [Melipona bicolor]|uniref:Uncharacterized protein n=1 Tax=Melipona bicolor TaxID=60889 RepID=A0AA40GE22_9HYME|nr:hypothetical protein K0M31_000589 [Melipona bicolor]